jgi:phosphonate transport system substrate-binding protein
MTFQITVSPDFAPEHIAGWYVFNTWLQRTLGQRCHLVLHDDFGSLYQAIADDRVDLIYANPYDATRLVREHGFTPLVAPVGEADEVVIATSAESPLRALDALQPGLRVAQTPDPDVCLIGQMMLEPADLTPAQLEPVRVASYVLVARHLVLGRADVGFFLKKAYDGLSPTVQRQLRVLVSSQISVMRHTLLAGPRMGEHAGPLRDALIALSTPGHDGSRVLEALGIHGFEALSAEETDLMIDLMDALQR